MSDTEPKIDPIAEAYETWFALAPDIRGAILHDLVEKSRECLGHAEAFEAAGPAIKDVWAQGQRRRAFAKAYECTFTILAHAGDEKIGFRHEPAPTEDSDV